MFRRRMTSEPIETMTAVRASRGLVISVGSPEYRSIPDEEWTRYCDVCETMQRELSGREVGCVLVVSDLTGPNASQRKQMAAVGAIRPHKAIMISSSVIIRGIVTALSWLGITMKAYPPAEWRRAFAEIDITTPGEIAKTAALTLACEAELGVPLRSLDPMRAEMGK